MRFPRFTGLLLFLFGFPLLAQQVQFIDLTVTPQRVELRHPPASPNQNGGYSGGSIGDCGADARDPRSLTVAVQNVIVRESDDPKRPFEVEFKVLNTGQTPMRLPISPHLSELQPDDASATFTYISLALAISPIEDRSSIGYVELYGKAERANTLITLNPGQWLRVEANVEFNLKLPPAGTINLESGYWLRNVTFHPHPGGFTTSVLNVCVNRQRPTPTFQVHRN
jgi:hypothetical protein